MMCRRGYVAPSSAALACLAALALVGCDGDKSATAAPSASASAPSDTLAKGGEIVAAVTKASFRQGTIVSLDTAEVTFEYGRPDGEGKKPRQTVPRNMVWLVGGPHSLAAGAYAVCKIAMTDRPDAPPSWYPCQVKQPTSGKLRIVDHYAREHELDASSVIQPSPDVQKNVETYLIEENKHRLFDRAFEEAGRPPRPEGWDPATGDAVVIHFVGTSWYGGKVVENKRDKGKVRVSYDGGTWDDRDVPIGEIAPIPKAPASLAPGMFVICRPHTTTRRWEHNKVLSVSGDEVELENRDETRRKVKIGDVIPIVK